MRILGLDPGQSTGWALFDGEKLLACGVITGGITGFIEWAKSEMPPHDVLVVEAFVVEPSFVGTADASEVIGAAYALSDAPTKRKQLRSAKSTLINGSEAQRFEWLRSKGFEGISHDLDAITHVLLYLKAIGHKPAYMRYWAKKNPRP